MVYGCFCSWNPWYTAPACVIILSEILPLLRQNKIPTLTIELFSTYSELMIVCVLLRMLSRAACMLAKNPTTELQPYPFSDTVSPYQFSIFSCICFSVVDIQVSNYWTSEEKNFTDICKLKRGTLQRGVGGPYNLGTTKEDILRPGKAMLPLFVLWHP